ncbi:MAG: hypothetical protein HY000_33400 [Planctomycetes bacterium]|nr:hypothetical protein [Planctomycetota bacterium]
MDFLASHWGDLASVVSLAITLWLLVRTKRIARAVEEARAAIQRNRSVADLSEAVSVIEEILRMQRAIGSPRADANLAMLVERYRRARHLLVTLRPGHQWRTADIKAIESAKKQMASLEDQVERAFSAGTTVDLGGFTTSIKSLLDGLRETLERRIEIGV